MLIAVQLRYSVEAGLLLLGFCVLIGPLLAERARIPGLIGLVAGGALLGPHVMAWLQPGGFVATLGAAGLLYLMFVAGVELDLRAFMANRHAALTFGLLTFAVPFGLSYVVGRYHLGLGLSATALVGAMWASHTVVSYPEVKRAGADRNRSVGVSLAATVITDVLALIVLALAASSTALDAAPEVADALAAGTIETSTRLPLWAGVVLMGVVCFVVIPRATRWLFAHVLFERSQRFVWVLVAMALGAVSGLLGGIEGLVGAFLAGIGVNSSVPVRSELMERIDFIGSALLIPAFLVSVGLSIDPAALADPSTLALAAVFTATVIVGKVVAAIAAGLLFSYERAEIALMSALTVGQAAATLAIAQVGVDTGLFTAQIRYAAIVTVVVTVVAASVVTRLAARRVPASDGGRRALGDHVVVLTPGSEIDTAADAGYAALASSLVARDGGLITPASIRSRRGLVADASVRAARERLGGIDRTLVRLGHDTDPVERVSDRVPFGVGHLVDELDASLLVVPVPHDRLVDRHDRELPWLASSVSVPLVAIAAAGPTLVGRVVAVVADAPDGADEADATDETTLTLEIARLLAATRSNELWVWGDPSAVEQRRLRIRRLADGPFDLGAMAPLHTGDLVVAPIRRLSRRPIAATDLERLTDITLVGVAGRPGLGPSTVARPSSGAERERRFEIAGDRLGDRDERLSSR